MPVNARQIPTSNPRSSTQDTPHFPSHIPLRGYHPLRHCFPADFECAGEGRPKSYNPTSSFPHRKGVWFALCRFHSPLLTTSQLFSLPLPTKMLHFGRFLFPSLFETEIARGLRISLGNPRVYVCLRLTWAFRSLPRPYSASRTKPSTKWILLLDLIDQSNLMVVSF